MAISSKDPLEKLGIIMLIRSSFAVWPSYTNEHATRHNINSGEVGFSPNHLNTKQSLQ